MEKKGTTRSNVDPKLRKRRDLKNLLLQKKGDVYLAYSSTHAYHEAWLVDSGASGSVNMKGMMKAMFS